MQVGWQEHAEAATLHLLNSSLAQHQDDAAPSQAVIPETADIYRLRRHVQLVVERLAKRSVTGASQPAAGPTSTYNAKLNISQLEAWGS